MTPSEKEISRTLGRLVRSARIASGYRQVKVAQELQMSQGALSKVETGRLILSAPQWMVFCELTKIPPSCLMEGFIDHGQIVELRHTKSENGFKIPKRYRNARASKVRVLHPFKTFFQKQLGNDAWEEYLETLGFDPAFFSILDNQMNLNFVLDLCKTMTEKGVLNRGNVGALAQSLGGVHAHGVFHSQYASAEDECDLVLQLIENVQHYERNFSYRVVDHTKKSIDLSITPEYHLDRFDYRYDAVLGDFLCQFKKQYLKQFSAAYKGSSWKIEEAECHFKGDSRCLYQLTAAA